MRSRQTAARRLLHICILTALLTGACYANWGLLPGTLKEIPIDAIRAATGFETDFGRAHYIPFRGVFISDPILIDHEGRELFRAKSIRLTTDLPAYFKEDRIVIRKIEVDSPESEVRLSRPARRETDPAAADPDTQAHSFAAGSGPIAGDPSPVASGDAAELSGEEAASVAGTAPAPDGAGAIVPLQSSTPHPFIVLAAIFDDAFLPSNVYLNELEIRHGRIALLPPVTEDDDAGTGEDDHGKSDKPIETLREVRFFTKLDERPRIPVIAEFRTGFGRGDFRAEGLVDLSDTKHRLALKGHIDRLPEWLAPTLEARGIRVERLRGDAQLALIYDGRSLITFRAETKRSTVRASLAGRTFGGDLTAQTSGTFDFTTGKIDFANGMAEASGVELRNLAEHIDEVRISSAAIAWDPERMEVPRIQGAWRNTNFMIDGVMAWAEERQSRFTFRHSLKDLEPLRPLAPKLFDHPLNPGSLKGDIRVQAVLEGPAAGLLQNIRSVRVDLRGGELSPRFLKAPVTDIAGAVTAEPLNIFSTEDLFFRVDRKNYTLSGQYNTLPGGAGRFALTAPKWESGGRFKSWPDRLEFSTFTLQSGASHLGASGVLRLGERPAINADFRTRLVSEELAADWHAQAPWLKNLRLKGVIEADGSARGPAREFTALQMNVKARSSRLTYADRYSLEPVEADLRLDAGVLDLSYGKAGLYGGEARATGRADLTNLKRPYFETHVFAQNADLEKFAAETGLIKNKFSGLLNLDLDLAGVMNDPNSLKGRGSFNIEQGELWQTELFKRLKKVLFLTIEGADNVVFRRASGSFTIGNGGIETRDAVLSSKLINVRFDGRIGFDSKLAMNVVSRFTTDLLREASEVGGLTPALINIAENKITRYLVGGTLKEPSFTPQN